MEFGLSGYLGLFGTSSSDTSKIVNALGEGEGREEDETRLQDRRNSL